MLLTAEVSRETHLRVLHAGLYHDHVLLCVPNKTSKLTLCWLTLSSVPEIAKWA
jgi:hypothetical protein